MKARLKSHSDHANHWYYGQFVSPSVGDEMNSQHQRNIPVGKLTNLGK